MPLLSTFGAASARGFGFGILSGIAIPDDNLFNTVSFLSHFEGVDSGVNNSFNDSSSSNHTITANGNVTQGSFGPFARAAGEWGVSFDGSSDSLTFTNDAGMSLDGDYTFELWFNASTIVLDTQHPNMIIIGTTQLFINSTSKFVSLYDSGADIVKSADNAVDENEWYHVAAVRSGSGSNNTSLYLNGTRVAQATNTATLGASSGTGRIGSYSGTGGDFNGHISNIRLVKGTALYSGASITVPSSTLTAVTNTKLLTCQSNRFVDNSTSAHTITVSGTPAISAFGPFLTSEVYDPAVNGASAYFDGSGDYITLSPTSDFAFGTGDFSVSLWAYFTDVGAYDYLIDARNSGQTASTWALSFNYTNSAPNKLQFASGGTAILTSNTNVQADQWYYISVSRTGTTSKMHFNGVEVASNSSDSTNYSTAPNTSYIGSRHSVEHFFDGYMSNLRVVKGTGLSYYTPPTAPTTAVTNTKLLLNMADGQAFDSTAQNNLTLFGDAKVSNTQAKFGDTSLYLDGTGDYVRFPQLNGPLDGAGEDSPLTIEGWFYWDGAQYSGGFNTIIGINRLSDGNNTMLLYCGNNVGADHLGLRYNGSSEQILSDPIATNTWHHFAMVLNNGSYKFQVFLNGTSVFTSATTINVAPSDCSFLIGAEADAASAGNLGDYFSGYIDEVRISHTARYTSNFVAPTEPFADIGDNGRPPVFMKATGGTITTVGDYKFHTFTSSGTFEVTKKGDTPSVDILCVAGGGAGAGSSDSNSGGGGAGGYLEGTLNLTEITYAVTVGQGGASSGAASVGSNGQNSVIGTINATAIGGGYGGGGARYNQVAANSGGSGGGGSGFNQDTAGGSGTQGNSGGLTGYGNNGGSLGGNVADGGGGAGEAGNTDSNGHGGDGRTWSGNNVTYAGGGGGGYQGTGGTGGGGNGYQTINTASNGEDGTANTGGGGGGSYNAIGASGGSGIVIFKYKFQ